MNKVISEISKELNIPEEVVKKAYTSFFDFIRCSASELPLKDKLTEEEFNNLRCNFNIPSLGKLYVTYDRYLGMHKRFEYIKNLKEKHEYKEN